jgi:hypothetical protein
VTTPAIAAVTKRLPLRLRQVEWTDPTLTVLGDEGFALNATCPWRVTAPDGIPFGWASPEAGDLVHDLAGLDVVAVERQARRAPADPAFVLSSGWVLELFADTAVDPWTLRVGDDVLVGPLEADDWPPPA